MLQGCAGHCDRLAGSSGSASQDRRHRGPAQEVRRLRRRQQGRAELQRSQRAGAAGQRHRWPRIVQHAAIRLRHSWQELAHWNERYEQRFGHLFIICASGKPASVMLAALKTRCAGAAPVLSCKHISKHQQPACRYGNTPAQELATAAGEQMKITELRLLQLAARSGLSQPSPGSAQQAARRAGQTLTHLGACPLQPVCARC